MIPIEKYMLPKKWVKMSTPALRGGHNNLQTPINQAIWVSSQQLDDQHRNPNINKTDRLVGQLTNTEHDRQGGGEKEGP